MADSTAFIPLDTSENKFKKFSKSPRVIVAKLLLLLALSVLDFIGDIQLSTQLISADSVCKAFETKNECLASSLCQWTAYGDGCVTNRDHPRGFEVSVGMSIAGILMITVVGCKELIIGIFWCFILFSEEGPKEEDWAIEFPGSLITIIYILFRTRNVPELAQLVEKKKGWKTECVNLILEDIPQIACSWWYSSIFGGNQSTWFSLIISSISTVVGLGGLWWKCQKM